MNDIIRYTTAPVEGLTVQRGEGNTRRIRGVASVYYNGAPGTEYGLGDGMVERIAPGAFDHLLTDDVICCVNHDPATIVGRTPTMKLFTTPRGLEYEVDLPDTTAGRDLWENVQRGLIRGSSFRAQVNLGDKEQVEWTRDGNADVLTIKRFSRLKDVSPVTDPAYKATDVSAVQRSLQDHRMMEETIKRLAVAARLLKEIEGK